MHLSYLSRWRRDARYSFRRDKDRFKQRSHSFQSAASVWFLLSLPQSQLFLLILIYAAAGFWSTWLLLMTIQVSMTKDDIIRCIENLVWNNFYYKKIVISYVLMRWESRKQHFREKHSTVWEAQGALFIWGKGVGKLHTFRRRLFSDSWTGHIVFNTFDISAIKNESFSSVGVTDSKSMSQ